MSHDWLLIRGGANFRRGSGLGEAQERALFSALCTFINDHQLSLNPLPNRADEDWEGFEIRHSHLTPLGQLVMKSSLSRWLAAIDRGTDPHKSKILLHALERARSSGVALPPPASSSNSAA